MSQSGSARRGRPREGASGKDSVLGGPALASSLDHAGHRHARLEELLRDEVIGLLRDEVTDPLLQRVQIAAVVLSVDYRHARLHFTIQRHLVREGEGTLTESGPDSTGGPLDRHRVEAALARAIPFFRGRLGEAIELKRVPDLRFVFDAEAVDYTGVRST